MRCPPAEPVKRVAVRLDADFADRMQKSMTRAMNLIARERAHHTLCVRAPTMLLKYKEDWQLAWHDKWPTMSEEQQEVFRGWFQQIENIEQLAEQDIEFDYESAKRRSVILLGDLMEGFVEALLEILIVKSTMNDEELARLTGFKKAKLDSSASIMRAIRNWERTKHPGIRRRTQRIDMMLNRFMPFCWPTEEISETIDTIFKHRNRLTHEIIQIEFSEVSEKSADTAHLSLSDLDNQFVAVGEFIGATLQGFRALHSASNSSI